MADKKISELTGLSVASGANLFVIVDTAGAGETKNITLTDLMSSPGPIGGVNPNTGEFTTLTLPAGATISEFSIDGTLAGDSDLAIPTEKAVKTYSDRIPLVTSEPTGFPNTTDSAISMGIGPSNRFSIAPTGVSYDYWIVGDKTTKSGTDTVDLTDVHGLHFIYFDGATLTESTVFDPQYLKDKAYVAAVYWDTTSATHIYMGDERHGLVMDWATHLYLHTTRGTVWTSGLALADLTSDGTGNVNIDAQFGYTQGTIFDEDLEINILEQTIPANIPIFYQVGSTGEWRRKTANDFPVLEGGSTSDYSGTRLAYNDFDGANWNLTEVSNDGFVLMHYFASNDPDQGVIGVVGQNEYATATEAKDAAKTELETLILTDLPFVEFTALATTINKTSDSFTNTPKSALVSTEEGDDYVDWRGVQGQSRGSVAVSDHGNLTGLGHDDHLQYILVTGTRGFTGVVEGIYPVLDSHLSTKEYVDDAIAAAIEVDVINGSEPLNKDDSTGTVIFDVSQVDTNYSVVGNLVNEVDWSPSIYGHIITEKTTTGFTILFSGPIDSSNYEFDWILSRNDLSSSSSSSSTSSSSSSSLSSSSSSTSAAAEDLLEINDGGDSLEINDGGDILVVDASP